MQYLSCWFLLVWPDSECLTAVSWRGRFFSEAAPNFVHDPLRTTKRIYCNSNCDFLPVHDVQLPWEESSVLTLQDYRRLCISSLLYAFYLRADVDYIRGGHFWYWYPACIATVNDDCAYFGGLFFGKPHLLNLNPNKTVEGFIAGFLAKS